MLVPEETAFFNFFNEKCGLSVVLLADSGVDLGSVLAGAPSSTLGETQTGARSRKFLTVSMPASFVIRQSGGQPTEEECFKRRRLETLPNHIPGG